MDTKLENALQRMYEILLMTTTISTLIVGGSVIPLAACWIVYHLTKL